MKKAIITAIAAIFLTGTLAHADYECQSVPQGATLTVQEQLYANHLGTDTKILHQEGSNKAHYFGHLQSEGGSFFEKEVVYIYPHYNGETLTIVSEPKFCGRSSCDLEKGKIIKAVLKVGNSETSFYCNEIKN